MTRQIILFDGVCNFCSSWVQWVMKRDPKKRFRFAPLQSAAGQRILREIGLAGGEWNTVVFVEGEKSYLRSTAFLRIVRRLKGPWPVLFILILIPAPIRNFFYKRFARNRYRWFGKRETCTGPTPDVKDRFLE